MLSVNFCAASSDTKIGHNMLSFLAQMFSTNIYFKKNSFRSNFDDELTFIKWNKMY